MLDDLLFANRQVYTDFEQNEWGGGIWYNSNDGQMVDIADSIQFSCGLTNEWVTHKLFEYADRKKLLFIYKLARIAGNPITYQLTYKFDLQDAAGNSLRVDYLNWQFPSAETVEYVAWSDTDPGFDTIPFSDMHYIPAFVDYKQGSQVTIANDPAVQLWPLGQLLYKVPRVPVGGYVNFQGVRPYQEWINSYYGLAGLTGYVITSQTAYEEYYGQLDPNDEWHNPGEPTPEPDPSGPGGGDRPTDDDGEPVDFPDLPTTSVINTGLVSVYNPDAAQLRSLAGVLWGNDFEESIKKILNDPFDGMIGLTMVPFSPGTNGSIACTIGNFSTQISMPLVSQQYYTLDCGSIQVQENWHNALDYNATSIEIFVPFVGFRSLDIQDCMGRTLALKYNVDILSGSGVAILKCGDKCLYEWPCNLTYDIPLTGSNKASLYTGLINVALSGAGGLAAGGAMGAVGGAAASAINVATHSQSNVQRSGSIVANTGMLGEFTPYIVIHRPKQSLAQNFKRFKGYESNITMVLGDCVGYTEVNYVHLTGIDEATDTELTEIEALLKSGVII